MATKILRQYLRQTVHHLGDYLSKVLCMGLSHKIANLLSFLPTKQEILCGSIHTTVVTNTTLESMRHESSPVVTTNWPCDLEHVINYLSLSLVIF